MSKREITKRVTFNKKPLSRTRKRNQGFYVDLLVKIERFHDYVHWKYSKSFYIRLDLTYPLGTAESESYSDDNVLFRNFINVLMRPYTRLKIRTDYFWVRERSTSGCHHYHIVLVFDGNRVQNGYGVFERAKMLWARALWIQDASGLVDLFNDQVNYKYGGMKVVRGSATEYYYDTIFEQLSYLAKVYSKDTPKGINEYGHSRIHIPDGRFAGIQTPDGSVDTVTGELFKLKIK